MDSSVIRGDLFLLKDRLCRKSPAAAISVRILFIVSATLAGPMRIATITCGYGDGYHRAASGQAEVLIRGKRAKVLGRICMDQMMADVTEIPDARTGDTAVLMGSDGEECITAEDIAGWCGTISYEVLLSCGSRVEKQIRME